MWLCGAQWRLLVRCVCLNSRELWSADHRAGSRDDLTKRKPSPIRIGHDLLGRNKIIDRHKLGLRGQELLPLLISLTCLMGLELRDLLRVHNLD